MVRFAYTAGREPPAPMVPVRISGPLGEDAVMLAMLVDTGADCTVVPEQVVRRLGLPQVGFMAIAGVGGGRRPAAVHAAHVEFAGVRVLARVVALADEAILGRDVLNQTILRLDGPGLTMSVRGQPRRRRPG